MNLYTLPKDIPVPKDDGACDHLEGTTIPAIRLISTNDRKVDFSLEQGIIVIYLYPMIGNPDSPPTEEWNEIPGARGCTPQSCEFRDHFSELKKHGANSIFGLSSQTIEEQKEAANRLNLPFELLSDASLIFANALNIPKFEYKSRTLLKRLTLVVKNGTIIKSFYPVFPPNENAENVIKWLRES